MAKKNEYAFVVMSVNPDGTPHLNISHYVFDNVNDANEFKTEMESDTGDKFVSLMVRKMNKRPKV